MALIKVLYVPADWQQPTEVREVSNQDMPAFQAMVGGDVEEFVFLHPFVIGLFFDEAPRLQQPLNARVGIYLATRFKTDNRGLGFRGNIVFVSRADDGEWGSVNQDVTKWFEAAAAVARLPLA